MLNDKVVFITGAGSGIGKALALSFAAAGARIVICDIDSAALGDALTQVTADGGFAKAFVCDVTSEDEIRQAVLFTERQFGPVEILINNAGLQHVAPIEQFPTESFEEMIRVMLVGPFLTSKHVLTHMKERKFGRIINMASINGLIGFAGKAAYNSAKHGLIGLTKVCALETAEFGVTVNALCPGYVDTPLVRKQLASIAKLRDIPEEAVLEQVIYPLIPQKRLLSPEEVASFALFIAGEQAGGITGQALVIDGGYTAQ